MRPFADCRRYAQLICSVISLQTSGGGADGLGGIGGGGENMMAQDLNTMRAEMIGTSCPVLSCLVLRCALFFLLLLFGSLLSY
jgi:hypothetical protein